MSIQYNEELGQKLGPAISLVEETVAAMKKAMPNCLDIAKETGSSELMKTYEGANSSVEAMCKTGEELVESLTKLHQTYQKLERAVNNG